MPLRRSTRSLIGTALAGLALAAGWPALGAGQQTGHAHVHGVATLELVLEARQLSLRLEAPLDNLVGFERAPRGPAERRKVDAAVAALRSADLVGIDPAAGCRPRSVELTSAVLGLGQPEPGPAVADGHAELAAELVFDCRDGASAGFLELGLFKAFPRMRQVDVRGVAPGGQFARTLKRPATRLDLPRR